MMKYWLLLASILISILVAEVGVRILTEPAIKKQSKLDGLAVWDDELGWKSPPNFSAEYYDHTVKTNSLGFRDTEWDIAGSDGRILLLGDSFGWGWGVPVDSCFANHIERITGREVINMSVSGYSTDQELLIYDNMKNYSHDTVILQLYSNDVWYSVIGDVLLYMRKPRIVEEFNNYTMIPPRKLEWYEKLHKWSIHHSEIMAKLWFATHQKMNFNKWLYQTDSPLYKREIILLINLQSMAKKSGKEFYVFSYAGNDWLDPFGKYEAFIGDCMRCGINIIPLDCEELYDEDWLWIDGKHWNEKGHRIVAEKICEKL